MFIPAYLQQRITGVVRDESGNPLEGAYVLLENSFHAAVTGKDGRFTLSGIKQGKAVISLSFVGYESETREIVLPVQEEVEVVLKTRPVMAEEVIVRGIRAGNLSSVTQYTMTEEMLRQNNLGKDLPALLTATPSFITNSDAGNDIGYTSFQIRGTEMSRINITINGIPLNDAESHDVFWVDLPDFAASVEDIQIQRGVGTSTNGAAAFGASVNIQTRELQREPFGRIDQSIGSFNTFRQSLNTGTGLINNHYAFNMRLSRISSDGYIDRAFSDLKSFFVSGGYYSRNTILKINVFSGAETTYQAWEGIPSSLLNSNRTYNPAGEYTDSLGNKFYYDNQTDNYWQDHFQMLFSQHVGKSLNLNLGIYYTRGKGYYESYVVDQDLSKYGEHLFSADSEITESDLVRQKWLDNSVVGFTFSSVYDYRQKIKLTLGGAWNHYLGDHFGQVIWARDIAVNNPGQRYYFNDGYKNDANIFGKAEYSLLSNLHIYGDLQYRQINQAFKGTHDDLRTIDRELTFRFLNPKLGISYIPDHHHRLYASFGVAGREPTRRNFIDADPGHDPVKEVLYDYELGYHYASQAATLALNLYYMDYSNQLVLTGKINNVGEPIWVNVPRSYRAGVEFTSDIRFSSLASNTTTLTLSTNKIRSFFEYIDNWDTGVQESVKHENTNLSFSPGFILYNALLFQPLHGLKLTLESKYVGKQFIDNTSSNERILNPYLVNNLKISYLIENLLFREMNLSLFLNNIFNEKYETKAWIYRYISEGEEYSMDGYFPQAGRHIMAGISILF